jgi:short subunit dehydrogenase-like uncharacterized protein
MADVAEERKIMIYGAYGYTGELVARLAVERGHRPILAGRHPEKVAALAEELGCEARVFKLEAAQIVEQELGDVEAVVHCAGPFLRTYRPMSKACLRTATHYLDVTGEAAVFESLAAVDSEAREAGVMLLPGVGFDVVPSDCLAAHLKQRLPSATHLTLGFRALGKVSRGTATTMVENFHRGGLVREDGRLKPVPAGYKVRHIDFAGDGKEYGAVTIPWGDVATAYHSTGIPNIEVYMAAPAGQRRFMKFSRYIAPILGLGLVQGFLKGRIRSRAPGPTEAQRERGRSFLWGEVRDAEGHRAVSRLETPEGYSLTALTAVAAMEKVMAGQAPAGFQTPSTAYGADFILEVEGVKRTDEAPSP